MLLDNTTHQSHLTIWPSDYLHAVELGSLSQQRGHFTVGIKLGVHDWGREWKQPAYES